MLAEGAWDSSRVRWYDWRSAVDVDVDVEPTGPKGFFRVPMTDEDPEW